MRRVFSIAFSIALVLGFSLVATTPAAAATLTVNTGLPNVPPNYWTIQAAVNAANPGDTINVAAGTYVEAVNVNKSLNLKGTLSGGGVPLSIIRPDGTTPSYDSGRRVGIYVGYGPPYIDGVTIEGFEIDGTATTVHIGILLGSSNGSTVRNNVIHDITNQIGAPGSDVAGVGICVFGWGQGVSNTLIEGNTVYNTGRMGIGITAWGPTKWNVCSSNAIKNNTVHHAWQGPTNDAGGAVQINVGKDCSIEGNAISDSGTCTSSPNYGAGIYMFGSGTGNIITCNTITNNPSGITLWISGGGSASIDWGAVTAASPDVSRNRIYSNPKFGARSVGTPIMVMDAEDNWWGDDSGPYHSSNPGGMGNPVSDNVDFTPWIDNSVITATGTGTASFAASEGNILSLTGVMPPAPPPVTLPHGMFNFTICCLTGSTATLSMTFPQAIPVGYKWWKYVSGSWYSLPIGSDDGDSFITVTLTDGAFPDDEDTIPGQITDQGGPGFGGAVGWETYAISKVRVLLPWIALLAAIIAGATLLVVRRRQTKT